jgi:pyruvate/2-oxoglutarate/acetoin dehydrogenase E1 component
MTILAFLPVTTCMYIIQPVADIAFPGYVLVTVIDMATVTGKFRMLFPKREIRVVVIKIPAGPAVFSMAIRAMYSKSTRMHVVILMACNAILWCVAKFFPGNMASCAASYKVCSP